MPSWAAEDGRYYWRPPGATFDVEIPHPPFREAGCKCALCVTPEPPREPDVTDAEFEEIMRNPWR